MQVVPFGQQLNCTFCHKPQSDELVHEALADLPDNTVIDGEVVALEDSGRPDFNLLQHYRTQRSRIHCFVFDLLVYQGRDLTRLPLVERRGILKTIQFSSRRIRIAEYFEASAADMLSAARTQGLAGCGKTRELCNGEAQRTSNGP